MGNSCRPGSVVTREIDHPSIVVDGEEYVVRELHWNGITGRSFDVYRVSDDQPLNDESFGDHPSVEDIGALVARFRRCGPPFDLDGLPRY